MHTVHARKHYYAKASLHARMHDVTVDSFLRVQTFTFSLNKPEQSRAVDVRFALYDFDVLSQPDLVGSCTYDVNTLLKECMQQQREVIVEKQWIPLMIYKTSLLSRLKPSWLPAPAAFGDLEPKIRQVKGHDRKPSRICCTLSCSPPEVLDQNGVEADEMDAFVIKRPVVLTKHASPGCTHVQVPVVFARNDHHFGFQIGQDFFALDQLVFGSVLGNITTVEHKVRLNF